jgi:hypothetical protein
VGILKGQLLWPGYAIHYFPLRFRHAAVDVETQEKIFGRSDRVALRMSSLKTNEFFDRSLDCILDRARPNLCFGSSVP